jgi:hypothetical protein
MRTVGLGVFALAFGARNQWSRINEPSKAFIVQSLATPGTRVATTAPPVFGGVHFGVVTAVAPVGAEDDGDGDDVDADDEQAASAATNRLVPNRLNLARTFFPRGRFRPTLATSVCRGPSAGLDAVPRRHSRPVTAGRAPAVPEERTL